MDTTQNQAITGNARIAFDAATSTFITAPSAGTLALLSLAANALVAKAPVTRFATSSGNDKHWQAPANGTDFLGLRITTDRRLTDAEVQEATDATNYALKIYVGMAPLDAPRVTHGGNYSIIEFDTDSTPGNRTRTAPNYVEAFTEAAKYVQEGSPVRVSDRAGVGTAGTRLVAGIGTVGVKFEVHPV